MAISGSYTAGDYDAVQDQVIGLDIADTGTYADVTSWTVNVDIQRGTRPTSKQRTHSGAEDTATGAISEDVIVLTMIYDEVSTGPYANLFAIYESSNRDCDVKVSRSSLTTPTTGDITWELANAQISALGDPQQNAFDQGEIPTFTATFTGTLATSQA